MKKFRLKREGDVPLEFDGEVLVSVDGQAVRGPDQNRWIKMSVCRTANGKYVLGLIYQSYWEGEDTRYCAAYADDAAVLRKLSLDMHPERFVNGYDSASEQQRAHVAKYANQVAQQYAKLLVEVFDAIPEASERI